MSISPSARILDISQPLDGSTAAWPGDQPFELGWTLRRDAGDSVDVAAIRTSVHVGTHVDGPRHVIGGPAVGSLGLEPFIGPAVVLDVRGHVAGEPPSVSPAALDDVKLDPGTRVLLRTRDADDPTRFPERFAALSPSLCDRLVDLGCVLVGTDAPSVDPVDSRRLEAHRVLAGAGIPNLENLVLSGVEPGVYTLIALPLRLMDADSSPARAVLIRSEPW